MKVEKIDHVHIFVKNLDKALKFFEEALGTRFAEPRNSKNLDARTTLDPIGLEIIEGVSRTVRSTRPSSEGGRAWPPSP